jgi:hypothetical protein
MPRLRMIRWRDLLLMGLLLAAAPGCGSDQVSIKGEVTLEGKAVGPGSIVFLPQAGTQSRKAAAAIIDGKYEIPADRGPTPGTFRVEISWSKKTGRKIPSADPVIPLIDETREAIPKKYNSKSILTVKIVAGENKHDFALEAR